MTILLLARLGNILRVLAVLVVLGLLFFCTPPHAGPGKEVNGMYTAGGGSGVENGDEYQRDSQYKQWST